MNKPLCDYADCVEAQLNELELPTEMVTLSENEIEILLTPEINERR